jgi:hypothetical protein
MEWLEYILYYGVPALLVMVIWRSGRIKCLYCGGVAKLRFEPFFPYVCTRCGGISKR